MPQDEQVIHLEGRPWRVGERIGSGGFAEVYEASSEEHPSAAIKLIRKARGAERELLFQDDLEGIPNVVPVLASGEWEDCWVLAMPRAEKSLRARLGEQPDLDLNEVVGILEDLADALVGMAGRVVHRDIKPENILLLNGRWCFADFGISRYAEATTAPDTRKFALTPRYAAPEQWRGERATSATDVYAIGVVAYEMLAGSLPFSGPDFRSQHLSEEPASIPDAPPMLQSLVQSCLIKPPQGRPSASSLLERLNASLEPSSDAARRLQEANEAATRQRAEEERQKAVWQTEEENRRALGIAARQQLENVVQMLCEDLEKNAPEGDLARFTKGGMAFSMNHARLRIDTPQFQIPSSSEKRVAPFDVVAFTGISVTTERVRGSYEGRSHSLWYCDAVSPGEFRWYETAFMFSPLVPRSASIDPFASEPDGQTYLALAPGMHTVMVAWPFSPIDHGREREFMERWIGWFVDAASGKLHPPSHMPEMELQGSWRVGD